MWSTRMAADQCVGEVLPVGVGRRFLHEHLHVQAVEREGSRPVAGGRAAATRRPRSGRRAGRSARTGARRTRSGARPAARPGPSGAGPRMMSSWRRRSCSVSSASTRPARSPKPRNSVPLPTPASAATASIDTQSGPCSANRRSAAASTLSRLRAASARSGTSSWITGSCLHAGADRNGHDAQYRTGPQSGSCATLLPVT